MTTARCGKHRTRAFYRVTLRPNTDAAAVAEDLVARLGDQARPMRVLAIWSDVDGASNTLGATVVYEAKGANANDVWRRICGATPVSRDQVEVVELATFNLDADLREVLGYVP